MSAPPSTPVPEVKSLNPGDDAPGRIGTSPRMRAPSRFRADNVDPDLDRSLPNPFDFLTPWTTREKIKSFCLIPLMIARLALLVIVCPIYIVLIKFMLRKHKPTDEKGVVVPMDAKLFHRVSIVTMFFARIVCFCFGFFRINVKGKPADAPIYVANHVSVFDAFVMYAVCTPIAISEKENLGFPVVGTYLTATQAILIDRFNKDSKTDALNEIKRRATTKGFPPLLIFPEGSLTNGTALISFRKGAFSCGVPVQPITLRWPHKHLDLSWTSIGPSLGIRMFRAMTQFYNSVEVEFNPVYQPTQKEIDDPILYAENVRTYMAKKMGIPVTYHSFEDAMLIYWGYERVKINFTVQEIRKRCNMNIGELRSLLKTFMQMDLNKDGLLDYREFSSALKLDENSSHTKRLFEMFDVNSSGKLDFREFVVGLSFISEKAQPSDRMRFAFEMFDVNGDQTLTEVPLSISPQAANPFDFLRQHPQFDQLRQIARQDPSQLEHLLNTMAETNPDMIPIISDNQEAFIRLLTSDEGAPAGGAGGGVLGNDPLVAPGPRPGTVQVQVTQADMDSINNLVAMGFDRNRALEAYIVFGRNVDAAANYLLSNPEDDPMDFQGGGDFGGFGGDDGGDDDDDDMGADEDGPTDF